MISFSSVNRSETIYFVLAIWKKCLKAVVSANMCVCGTPTCCNLVVTPTMHDLRHLLVHQMTVSVPIVSSETHQLQVACHLLFMNTCMCSMDHLVILPSSMCRIRIYNCMCTKVWGRNFNLQISLSARIALPTKYMQGI